MAKKSNYVTRRIVESKTVKIYSLENGELSELDTIEVKGKLSEKELAKKYNVNNIVTEVVAEDNATYGVPIDKFMEIAERLDNKETE